MNPASQTVNLANQNPSALAVKNSVFVQSNGTLEASGAINIEKSLTNEGRINISQNSAVNVTETYTQKAGASLTIGFSDTSSAVALSAKNFTIEGGNLIYAPQISSLTNETLQIPLADELKSQLGNFTSISISNTSPVYTYTLFADKMTLMAAQVEDAYSNFDGANKDLGAAIRTVKASGTATTFFATLDNPTDLSAYQTTINSLNNNATLAQDADILNLQSRNAFSSILDLQDAKGDFRISLNPYYSNLFSAHYAGSGISMSGKARNHALGGFISYGWLSNRADYADITSQIIFAGFNTALDFSRFKILFGIAAGGSFNKLDRSIYGDPTTFSAKYNNLTASAQLGFGYEIRAASASITPMILADYGFLHEGEISESAEILAVKYAKLSHHALNALAGVNYTHYLLASRDFVFGLHAFYERGIKGDFMRRAAFADAPNASWEQNYNFQKNGARFGAKLGYEGDVGFFIFKIDGMIRGEFKQIGGTFQMGLKFGGK